MGKDGRREKSAGLKPGLYNGPWPEWKRMVGANQAWGEFRFGRSLGGRGTRKPKKR